MKKFLFICVALIAFLAANASGGNYHQPDQLRTCIVQAPQCTPVMAVTVEPAQAVYNFTMCTVPAEKPLVVQITKADTWRNTDWGGSLAINCSSNSIKFRDAAYNLKIPLPATNANRYNWKFDNYNVNYSYGLRN